MSNKGGRVSPDYLADLTPEYARKGINSLIGVVHQQMGCDVDYVWIAIGA